MAIAGFDLAAVLEQRGLSLGAVLSTHHHPDHVSGNAALAARYPGQLDIVCADALTFDPRPLLGGKRAKIVANLPYNIATPLLIGWLTTEPWPPWYEMMVLMFQREVAERIVAREDEEAYGRLGVLLANDGAVAGKQVVPKDYLLDANCAYYFGRSNEGRIDMQKIGLGEDGAAGLHPRG